ncbi:hypothetical protein QQ054_06750 [Oscillatoria amoena NRMC-F 0135]|nr:hypothetical protein [Oscillatoria amoena NRMC-F 0135]
MTRKYKLTTLYKRMLADTLTPVNIYMKLRDEFPGSILLESSDYHGQENSLSMICCDPISTFKVQQGMIQLKFPDGQVQHKPIQKGSDVLTSLGLFRKAFVVESSPSSDLPGEACSVIWLTMQSGFLTRCRYEPAKN